MPAVAKTKKPAGTVDGAEKPLKLKAPKRPQLKQHKTPEKMTPKTDDKDNNNVGGRKREPLSQFENEAVSKFLLDLYLNGTVTARQNFNVSKQLIRAKFDAYLKLPANKMILEKLTKEAPGPFVFGSLLYRCNFLINTPRGCDYYRIKSSTLYHYFNQQIQIYDSRCLTHGGWDREQGGDGKADAADAVKFMDNADDPILYDIHEVDDKAPCHQLVYQGSLQQERQANFHVSSMGCDVCQLNFDKTEDYDKHMEYHGDETDFEFLRQMEREPEPILQLSVRFCKNSHYLCFTVQTKRPNLEIDKILVVLTHSMFDVHKARGSYPVPESGEVRFFVDSHLFEQFVEQPILIRFHDIDDNSKHFVEEHHYMRVEEIANVPVGLNPCRLPHNKLFKPIRKLPQYLPPPEIRLASLSEFSTESLCKISNEFNDYVTKGLRYSTYNIDQAMKLLLQVEDMDIILKYKSLMQRYATISNFNNEYILKTEYTRNTYIEGIVTPYDEILLIEETEKKGPTRDHNDKDILTDASMNILFGNNDDLMNSKEKRKMFFGLVERVSTRGRVTFVCDRKIPEDKLYRIIFRPARHTIRYQYRALELLNTMSIEWKRKFLFPKCDAAPKAGVTHSQLNLLNPDIAANPEQYQAVQNILHGPLNDAPYIIFGPPGTGKTTTITEAILQLYYKRPSARILVTAGSNSACDEVAIRLVRQLTKENDSHAVVRVYSRSNERRSDNIDELLLEYSNMYTAQFYPHVDVLHAYRIVVCTLTVVGKLATGLFGRNGSHFTHVFVDEAAACTEAEVLVGIMGTLSSESSLIISGDHKQLGPTLQSKRAADLGLDVSLMMRLMERKCYRPDALGNYDTTVQTRLIRNYRSHPEIVNLYNGLYYNNELMPLAPSDVRYFCENWHRSPNTKYPIMFHSAFGRTETEQTSPSMHNPLEVSVVMDYIKDLMYFGINGRKVTQQDIGVISPYKKQYLRIQDELNLRNWYQIETGSVETFQGREKNIIIVSFVRSFTKTLGFLDNPQRLNVSLSRPKSLLILVGNPKTLSQNPDIKYIIEQCQKNDTMVGATVVAAARVGVRPNSLASSMDELSLRSSSESARDDGHTPEATMPNASKAAIQTQFWEQSKFTPESDDSLDQLFENLPRLPTSHKQHQNGAKKPAAPKKTTAKAVPPPAKTQQNGMKGKSTAATALQPPKAATAPQPPKAVPIVKPPQPKTLPQVPPFQQYPTEARTPFATGSSGVAQTSAPSATPVAAPRPTLTTAGGQPHVMRSSNINANPGATAPRPRPAASNQHTVPTVQANFFNGGSSSTYYGYNGSATDAARHQTPLNAYQNIPIYTGTSTGERRPSYQQPPRSKSKSKCVIS